MGGHKKINSEDAKLWAQVAKTVKRLRATDRPDVIGTPPKPKKKKSQTPEKTTAQKTAQKIAPFEIGQNAPAQVKNAQPQSPISSQQVDARTLNRLKKGQINIDAKLDLHGMTLARAQASFAAFVKQHHHAGRTCAVGDYRQRPARKI